MVNDRIIGGPLILIDSSEAEESLLGSMHPVTRCTGLPFGMPFINQATEKAFMVALRNDWIKLVDMQPIQIAPNPNPTMCRVYMITAGGEARLRELREKKKLDGALKQ
jgi:hypothetical protein